MKIPNQQASAPVNQSMFDRGLNQLEQVADRALGGLNDLGQGFSKLYSQLTDPQTPASPPTTRLTPADPNDPAMANNDEHAAKIAAGVAARTAAAAAKDESNTALPEEVEKPKEKATSPDATTNIQQQILATLGLNFTDEGLDSKDITSASSLDALQGAFLSSLQANLFSGKAKQAENSETDTNQEQIADSEQTAQVDGEPSLVDTISEFSFGDNGLELTDAFDSVNILQHIPVVSGIYQQVTEQDMSAVAKLTGGFLYGGPVGLAVSAADLTLEGITGNSINNTVINFDYRGLLDGITDSVLGSGVNQITASNNKEVATTALSTAGLSSSVLEQLPQLGTGAG
ncbi:hypothetical protein [Thalassomonas actiniarum]|uniref:Uncharacterized protein n=1 Tax=Thalassomonas actiniarum TaxID=485447 RepID=A0AAE9YT02_9GAMM|nr:hypothetical protein [Thalassomonas actiniarum]WDD99041.1 hypothetical protein SG35_028130 [Thalassomonas actiniarum]